MMPLTGSNAPSVLKMQPPDVGIESATAPNPVVSHPHPIGPLHSTAPHRQCNFIAGKDFVIYLFLGGTPHTKLLLEAKF